MKLYYFEEKTYLFDGRLISENRQRYFEVWLYKFIFKLICLRKFVEE